MEILLILLYLLAIILGIVLLILEIRALISVGRLSEDIEYTNKTLKKIEDNQKYIKGIYKQEKRIAIALEKLAGLPSIEETSELDKTALNKRAR